MSLIISSLIHPAWAVEIDETKEIRMLNERIKSEPKNYKLLLRRAVQQNEILNFKECIDDVNRANEIKPTARGFFLRGMAFRSIGQMDKAVSDFTSAAKLDPKDQNAFAEIACLEAKLRHYKNAEWAFEELFKLHPGRTVERSRRAEMYLQMKRPQDAVKDILICLKTDSDRGGRCHEILGMAYMQMKQYQKAIDTFSVSLARRPYSVDARTGRAEAYEKLGKKELAKKDRQALRADFDEVYENAPFLLKK